jgi:hypothetical protein
MVRLEKEEGMDRAEKFQEDLGLLTSKLGKDMRGKAREGLERLRDRLLELHRSNVVKINHSVMEMVCAKPLILRGYEVFVEHQVDGTLTCDVYATKGDGSLIIEIETGFVPPEHALDPGDYLLARIASKITRYSNYTNKFALGLPPQYIPQIPDVLLNPPRDRTPKGLEAVKSICDLYYKNPPVSLDEVLNARLHSIYLIDVDNAIAQEIDPEAYLKDKPNSVVKIQ